MSTITGGSAPSGGPGRVHNYEASRAPGATDDITDGYLPGSFWMWPDATGGGRGWVCIDGAEGAAEWAELSIGSQISDGTNTVTAQQARTHIDSEANPHSVTAAQAGADPAGSAAAAQAAVQANLDTHKADTANPHSVVAGQVDIADAGGNYAATDVEAALAEEADARQAHEADTANPHSVVASQVDITDTAGNFTATDVEAALAEEADAREAHEADTANPHSVTAVQTGIYAGWVDGGTGTPASDLPSGWTVAESGDVYTITHNLGLSAVTDLKIVVTAETDLNRQPVVDPGLNSFDVRVFVTDPTATINVAVNQPFFFVAVA